MYIDVVPDVVICKINWLHYLSYEAIPRSSSTCHWSIKGTSSYKTVSYYGLCNGIPHVVPVFSSFSERIHI